MSAQCPSRSNLGFLPICCVYKQVLLVCHKNKWRDLSQKRVTSLFLFIEGGQENILIGWKYHVTYFCDRLTEFTELASNVRCHNTLCHNNNIITALGICGWIQLDLVPDQNNPLIFGRKSQEMADPPSVDRRPQAMPPLLLKPMNTMGLLQNTTTEGREAARYVVHLVLSNFLVCLNWIFTDFGWNDVVKKSNQDFSQNKLIYCHFWQRKTIFKTSFQPEYSPVCSGRLGNSWFSSCKLPAQNWYFVTEIVLTYWEKKMFDW